jgi:hypothetical protein
MGKIQQRATKKESSEKNGKIYNEGSKARNY